MARSEVKDAAPDTPVRLLHADEEHLRLAAVTLRRGGRFVLVMADRRLWPTALQLLCDFLPGHRFVEHAPTSSDEANRAISDPRRDTPGLTIVIRITGREQGPLETLNLRRESLVKAPANFLLVLDGDEAHNRFLREAPDCYSYRDLLVALEGEHAFEVPVSDEDWVRYLNSARTAAQREADPVERARLLYSRAMRAFRNDQLRLSRTLAEDGITALAPLEHGALNESERLLLAQLYLRSADDYDYAERHRRVRRARDILAPAAARYLDEFTAIESCMVEAVGTDLEAALDAVRRSRGQEGALDRPLMRLAGAYMDRHNIVRARQVLGEFPATRAAIFARDVEWLTLQAHLLIQEGAWTRASQLVTSTEAADLSDPMLRAWLGQLEADLLRRQGEDRAAQRIYDRLPPSHEREIALIQLIADRGHTEQACARIDTILQRPWGPGGLNAAELINAHGVLIDLTEQQVAAGGPPGARDALDTRLIALLGHFEREASSDPPWYRISCLLWQSEAYLKRRGAEHLAQACAEQAWTLADAGAANLTPRAARWCVVASLRLGDLAHAAARLSRGLQRAREHELQGDEAHLRGLALWHTALANHSTAAAEADLQAAFVASGSRLVEASVLARVGAALDRRDLLRNSQHREHRNRGIVNAETAAS
jgi:hypothetical protein